jgi:outer membrane protein
MNSNAFRGGRSASRRVARPLAGSGREDVLAPAERRASRFQLTGRAALLIAMCVVVSSSIARAQAPQPTERVTFDDAIKRALERNPATAIAAAAILRADALLTEARAASRLQINGNVTTTTLNTGIEFEGATVTPRNSVTAGLDVRMPVFAPARWALRTQALDQKGIAELSAADTRRQTALAAADAYLAIIARRQVVEANVRALETAKAHFDLASELEQQGSGSRLNQLRAQQEYSVDLGLVEAAEFALYRAQEALGVLLAADGPVDAIDEPTFDLPPDGLAPGSAPPSLLMDRADLRLFSARSDAASRVLADSFKDRLPVIDGIFQPQTTYPAQFFVTANSWRLLFQATVPIFDSGVRAGQRLERQAALDAAGAALTGVLTTARSEVRAAQHAVGSAGRSLDSARAAADQAQQVVEIVNISFRAGAATNIEVIDAERSARDADTAVAAAENTLRRARLDLLLALGKFP